MSFAGSSTLDASALRATRTLSRVAEIGRSRGRYGRLPLGPPEPPILQLPQFLFQPKRYVRWCRDAFGRAFTLRLPGYPPLVQFHQPDAARDVFTGSPEEFWAGEANLVLKPLLGDQSLLLLDGEPHTKDRKLLTPPFRGERMKAYGAVMRDITKTVMARYPEGRPFRFHDATQEITLEVILRTVFGLDEGAQLDQLRAQLSNVVSWGTRPELMIEALQRDLGPRSPWGQFLSVTREMRTTLRALIQLRRREGSSDRTDVLSLMLAATYEDGSSMSDDHLIDELVTLLVAGHETTATALAWCAHRLTLHEEVQEKARDEVLRAFPDGVVDPERVDKLAYIHALNQEALRIHPVVPGVGRRLHREATIGGVTLPRGVIVGVSIVLAHENPDVFPDPHAFRPERFLERRMTQYEYFPFGGGVRRCIGLSFALYEMDVVLATILATHRFSRGTQATIRTVRRSVTLAPSEGMPIIIRSSGRSRLP